MVAAVTEAEKHGNDSKIKIRRVSFVLTQKGQQNREAPNLGTFSSLEKAKEHERAVQFFKRH